MNAKEVSPKDWAQDKKYPIRILFDDGEYSVIWGKYQGNMAMGVRWNVGNSERGFPGQGAHPTWYVEPDFIAVSILQRILTLALDTGDVKYYDDILFAVTELNDKLITNK